MTFNPDPIKQAQEIKFSKKNLFLSFFPVVYFNYTPINSCDSCRNQTRYYGSWRKQRHGKWSGTLTYGINTI